VLSQYGIEISLSTKEKHSISGFLLVPVTLQAYALISAGGDLQACTDTATSALTETFADVLNLNSQALQLSSLASNCFASIGLGTLSCLTNASGTILSKALLITSSLTSDVGAFASELGQVSAQLAQCAADETSKVAAQFASILGTVQACALSGVPAA
jgi:hypothetical protein